MTYRTAMGPGMAALGIPEGPAHIRCDGCGEVKLARTKTGGPPMWLLKRKAPPGWKLIRHEDETRTDYCPRCK